MSKPIPYLGEMVLSNDFPAPKRVAHITIGAATTNDVVLSTTGAYALFTVPANLMVHEMKTLVTTAFTASVDLTIGDTDVDGWFKEAAIAATTAVATGIPTSSIGTTEAYSKGRIYSATDAINVTVSGATVAAGVGHVYMVYSMAPGD